MLFGGWISDSERSQSSFWDPAELRECVDMEKSTVEPDIEEQRKGSLRIMGGGGVWIIDRMKGCRGILTMPAPAMNEGGNPRRWPY